MSDERLRRVSYRYNTRQTVFRTNGKQKLSSSNEIQFAVTTRQSEET